MDWKKFGKKLLFPPVWLMLVLAFVSGGLLAAVFVNGWEQQFFACFIYVLAFYTLTVLCIFCCLVLPGKYRDIKATIYGTPLGGRYLTDRVFRTEVSLFLSLGISVLYVLINLLSWYFSRSWWFFILAVYYLIMAQMRFLLVRYMRKNEIGASILGEWKRVRICAYIMLLMNLALCGALIMILLQDKGKHYPGVLIYVMALYTFYSTIRAFVDIIKYREIGSPVMSTAKIVSLSAALVSMLNLETAMFAQFGMDMPIENQKLIIFLTGAGVSATVVTLSVGLIVKATKQIRSETYGKERQL